MSHNDLPLPRRRPQVVRYLLIAFGLLVALFAYQLLGPNPPIRVSKQTTFIISPLLPSGLPDYPTYFRDRLRTQVSPEDNAAVILWQAIEPRGCNAADIQRLEAELGIPPNSYFPNRLIGREDSLFLEELQAWYGDESPSDIYNRTNYENYIACEKFVEAIQSQAWKSEEAPPLARWLDAHESQLDLIVAASKCPDLYIPLPQLLWHSRAPLVDAWPCCAGEFSWTPRCVLSLRAMRHLGEGRDDKAWADILALYHPAQLFHQKATTYERNCGLYLEEAAHRATLAYLLSPHINPEQTNRAVKDVVALEPLPSLVPCVDEYGRIRALDAIVRLYLGQSRQLLEHLELNERAQVVDHIAVDWNFVLREVNQGFDRLVAALNQPDYPSQYGAAMQVYQDFHQAGRKYQNAAGLAKLTLSRSQRNEFLAVTAFSMLQEFPSLQNQARAEAYRRVISLVDALIRYHEKHAAFPQNLIELAPNYLPKLPSDPYTSNDFLYHPTSDGFVLYCAGDNGQDDGGCNEMDDIHAGRKLNWKDNAASEELRKKIPPYADDEIILRVPLPEFRLPAPVVP
jgi:hypothetical protein